MRTHNATIQISFFSQIMNGLPGMLWRFISWTNWLALAQGEDFLDASKVAYMQVGG